MKLRQALNQIAPRSAWLLRDQAPGASSRKRWYRPGFVLLALFGWSCAAAQPVYRIVGPDGRITFSDKPLAVPGTTTVLGPGSARPTTEGPATLPYELRQVTSRYPVTLYTSASCGPCSSGRNLLLLRGIPFTERTIATEEDNQALQRLSGENALPFLTIGGQRIKGFSDLEWQQFFDAAGYPKASQLPANYRNPAPVPLVAQQPAAEAQARTAPAKPADEAPPPPAPVADQSRNPAGIRF